MQTAEIRRRFLAHFENAGHTVVPSAPLLFDDPNLLFVNAGMVPFKPYFLGQETPPFDTRHERAEVRAHARHRGGRQDHPARHVLPDERQLLLRRLLQGRRHRARLGPGHRLARRRRLGFDPDKIWVTVLDSDDEARQLWKEVAGLPDERIQRRGLLDNYWHMGVPGPGGPCSEIYVDRGAGVRPRRRPGRRRGPVPGDLEPRLHAGGAHQRPRQGRLRRRRAAAQQEHRHRHGPGARRLPAAGQEQPVRDRRGLPGHRAGGRAHAADLRRRPRRRRTVPRHRRPRPQRADADRRRRHARQRGPRLRPAPAAAPGRPLDAPARLRRPRAARAAAGEPRADEGVLPRAGARLRPHLADRLRRGGGVPPDPRQGHADLRPRGREHAAAGGTTAVRRAGVRPARHVRLPDRPDPGDGRPSRASASTRTASAR